MWLGKHSPAPLQEVVVYLQRPAADPTKGVSTGLLVTASQAESLSAGYRHRNADYNKNIISAGKKAAGAYGVGKVGHASYKIVRTGYSSMTNSQKVAFWNGANEILNPGATISEASGGGPTLDPVRYRPEQHVN